MATKKTASKASAKGARASSRNPPWEGKSPNQPGEHHTLTPKVKAEAKRRAHAAGRPYPNLVDNMAVAKAKR